MRTRPMQAAAISLLVVASTLAMASTYRWKAADRPPITLTDALATAEKLLGDDAPARYCVEVFLQGAGPESKKEYGAWNLTYAAGDGSKKLVSVNMQGKGSVSTVNGPYDPTKRYTRPADLAEVRGRLEVLFKKHAVNATFTSTQKGLLVAYKTRAFQVYPGHDDGNYAEELQSVTGPKADGVWLQVEIVEKPDMRVSLDAYFAYWYCMRGTYLMKDPKTFISIDLRYGRNVNYVIAQELVECFGDSTSRQ